MSVMQRDSVVCKTMTDHVTEASATLNTADKLSRSANLLAVMNALTLEYHALERHVLRFKETRTRLTQTHHTPVQLPFRFATVRQLTLVLTDTEIAEFLAFADSMLRAKRQIFPSIPYQARFERFYIRSSSPSSISAAAGH